MSASSTRSLWRHGDFVKLWTAATVSVFGSLVTRTALPFAAILALDATPWQLGALGACEIGAQVLTGLVLSAMLIASLLGGWLGGLIGVRATLALAAAGVLASAAWLAISPVRSLDANRRILEPEPAQI